MLKGNPAASGLLTLLDCPFDANTSKGFWWKLALFDLYVVWCSNKKIILSYLILSYRHTHTKSDKDNDPHVNTRTNAHLHMHTCRSKAACVIGVSYFISV